MKCRLMRLKTVNEYEKWCDILDEFDPSFCAYNHANQNYKEYHNVCGYYIVRTNFTLFFVKQNNMTHRHRLDGPAILYGEGGVCWCVNNYDINDEIYPWAKENSIDLDNLTEVDKALIKLVWAD